MRLLIILAALTPLTAFSGAIAESEEDSLSFGEEPTFSDSLVVENRYDTLSSDAEVLGNGLTRGEHRWLKPKRHLLSPNPYAQTDFTAYTLEWGELKLGLASISFGLLPRTQISTVPLLFALGIYNGNVKINLVRAGPLDLSATASHYYLPLGGFRGSYTGVGGMASLRISNALSVHGGAQYHWARARGIPTQLPPITRAISGAQDIEGWMGEASSLLDGNLPDPTFAGEALSVRLAVDLRLNRRDSIVLQGQAITFANYRADLDLHDVGPIPLFGLDQVYDENHQFKLSESYTVTLSWQISFKQLDFRVGGGSSAVPYAWLLQANDVSIRMWGRTRLTDSRRNRGWRKNRKDVVKAGRPAKNTSSDGV